MVHFLNRKKNIIMNDLIISQNSMLEVEMMPINHTRVPLTPTPRTLLVHASPAGD